jgi:hypothetical protein
VLTRLDHLVILVRDLDRAVRDYEELGFTVAPGGEHADGLTRNALIPFKDGSYLELVDFVDPEDTRDNVWGWRRFLSSGGGLIDYCAASDDLAADVRRLGERNFGVDGPATLGTCLLTVVTPEQDDDVRHRLDATGPGPFTVGLATGMPGREEELDRRLSQGVSIRLLGRSAGVKAAFTGTR